MHLALLTDKLVKYRSMKIINACLPLITGGDSSGQVVMQITVVQFPVLIVLAFGIPVGNAPPKKKRCACPVLRGRIAVWRNHLYR